MTNAVEATDELRPEVEPAALSKQDTETLLESLASMCSILAVGIFVMTFVFQNFEIPSASMMSTLLIGDHVVVDRIALAPRTPLAFFMPYRDVQRNDIIVFYKPGEPDLFLVKRAIAIPGDHIHLTNGIVYLNGIAQNEPHAIQPANDGNPEHTYDPYRDNFPALSPGPYEEVTPEWAHELHSHIQNGDLVVPPGKVFAMGDNRTDSLDGRYWGFVPRDNIVGRPLLVYWSFQTPADQIDKQSVAERITFIGHVFRHIFDQTRWNRTLHRIL